MKSTSTFVTFLVFIIGFKSRTSLILGNNILPDLYWNTTNPIFLISNTDHIIDVNKATSGHQHDQINIVCPKYEAGTPNETMEKHIIYNVNKEEYDSCMINTDYPRVVAYCSDPLVDRIFTISFRSFSPLPNQLEFHPGKSYYFISTSSPLNFTSRIGGYCVSNNMKVVFKVAEKNAAKKPASDNKFRSDLANAVDNAVNFKGDNWRKSSRSGNTEAKAVKWKEEKSVEKKKYFFNDNEPSRHSSQSLLDRERKLKDKMLSDEESRIYFYTTTRSRVMDSYNRNQQRQFGFKSDEDQEESILEKFSSGSANLITLSVSYSLLVVVFVVTLRPFI